MERVGLNVLDNNNIKFLQKASLLIFLAYKDSKWLTELF